MPISQSDTLSPSSVVPGARTTRVAMIALAGFCLFLLANVGWETFLTYLFLGLTQGGLIALIAIGYSMVYGIILLINFAHGEIFMLSAYLMIMLVLPLGGASGGPPELARAAVGFAVLLAVTSGVSTWTVLDERIRSRLGRSAIGAAVGIAVGLVLHALFLRAVPFWIALLVSVAVSPSIGMALDTLAYKPLRNAPRLVPLITAIGMSLLLVNVGQAVFTPKRQTIPEQFLPGILTVGPVTPGMPRADALSASHVVMLTDRLVIPLVDVIIVALAVFVMLATNAFVQFTKAGKAMRACALDQTTARLMGINVNRTVALTFAIGSALAAVAAPFYVRKYGLIEPTMGYIVGILAFSSAVLGGIGNIKGAMIGGFLIGIIYNFVPLFESLDSWRMVQWLRGLPAFSGVQDWNFLQGINEWRLGIAYLFMIAIIIFKPTGILGQAAASRRA